MSAAGKHADVDGSAPCHAAADHGCAAVPDAAGPGGDCAGIRGPGELCHAAADRSQYPPPRSGVPAVPYFPSVTPVAPPAVPPVPTPPLDAAPRPGPRVLGAPPGAPPPVAPPQTRKVARLVSAEAAQSTLKLAADGQLPQLQLQENDKKDKGQGKSRSISPLVMIGAWILSVLFTVAIVVMTNSDSSSGVTAPDKEKALAKIEEYFGNPGQGELRPYQRWLREARQARDRRDFKAERLYYKKVLDLLHTETWGGSATAASRDHLEKGITGSHKNDQDLEQAILTVLGD